MDLNIQSQEGAQKAPAEAENQSMFDLDANSKPKPTAQAKTATKTRSAPSLENMGIGATESQVLSENADIDQMLKGAKMVNPPAVARDEKQDEKQKIFERMDDRDEQQIENSLLAKSMGDFVYQFCQKGKNCACEAQGFSKSQKANCQEIVMDLSWAGIQEVSRSMKISIQKHTTWLVLDEQNKLASEFGKEHDDPGILVWEFPTFFRAMVRAIDPFSQSVRVGIAKCSKEIKFRNGGSKPDEFAEQKAISKAERNALRQLVPQTMIKNAIKQFLESTAPKQEKVTEGTIKELHGIVAGLGISITEQELASKVGSEQTAKYCLEQLDQGNVEGFCKWLGKEPEPQQ